LIDIFFANILSSYLFILPTVNNSTFNASFWSIRIISISTLSTHYNIINTSYISVLLTFINWFDAELLLSLILIKGEIIIAFQTFIW